MFEKCPNCQGPHIGEGQLPIEPAVFSPGALRFRSFRLVWDTGVAPGSSRFWACLDCGHLWGRIDPERLGHFIVKHGSDETLEKWGLAGTGGEAPLPNV